MTKRKIVQPDLIHQLLADYQKPEDLFGENGILKPLTKAVIERWKLRKAVAADLRTIYTAATLEEAQRRLAEFDAKWGADYPSIVQSWQRNWECIVPFFDYPAEIRKVIYTNSSLSASL